MINGLKMCIGILIGLPALLHAGEKPAKLSSSLTAYNDEEKKSSQPMDEIMAQILYMQQQHFLAIEEQVNLVSQQIKSLESRLANQAQRVHEVHETQTVANRTQLSTSIKLALLLALSAVVSYTLFD